MLCFRCEYRARYFEKKISPRFECSKIDCSLNVCYMFMPCKPIIMKKYDEKDIRPEFKGYFGAKMIAIKICKNCKLNVSKLNYLYWQ